MRDAAVLLAGLRKTYGEGATAVDALRGVDLAVPTGEFVVLLGPSGSGKTTLLNIVGAIELPSAGRVQVAGRDLSALDAAGRTSFRRDSVGFVFQFLNLVPTLTARENVALVLDLIGAEDPEQRARAALEEVGLGNRLDRFPGELSGGEQQRVAIARAVAKDPGILLCDEPTGSLDLDTGRTVLGLLRRLNREQMRTVLLVTHNSAIGGMADRVVRLRSGEIVADEHTPSPIEAEEVSW